MKHEYYLESFTIGNWRDSGSLHAVVLLLGWMCAGLQILMAWAKGWNLWIWLPAWILWALCITETWWTRRKRLKKEKQENGTERPEADHEH